MTSKDSVYIAFRPLMNFATTLNFVRRALFLSLVLLSLLLSPTKAKAWEEISKKEGVTVWQKKVPGSPFVAFRAEDLFFQQSRESRVGEPASQPCPEKMFRVFAMVNDDAQRKMLHKQQG